MRKLLLVLAILLIPATAHAASSLGAALLGIGAGAVIGVFGLPYILPTAIAAAPVVVEAVTTASTTAGNAIVSNPEWAGGIIGAFLGLLMTP